MIGGSAHRIARGVRQWIKRDQLPGNRIDGRSRDPVVRIGRPRERRPFEPRARGIVNVHRQHVRPAADPGSAEVATALQRRRNGVHVRPRHSFAGPFIVEEPERAILAVVDLRNEGLPFSFDILAEATPVSMFVVVTRTPATAAPLESDTRPLTMARNVNAIRYIMVLASLFLESVELPPAVRKKRAPLTCRDRFPKPESAGGRGSGPTAWR